MEPNIAVLIDFENIAAGSEKEGLGKVDVGLIMNRLREKGRVLIARSYADWGRFARYKKAMMLEGVSLFELSAHGMNDKNRADVALVVDCMELAMTKDYVDTFVVVSGDSDFTPLIQKLRELNKRVLGVGTRRSTSRLIVEACDEFIFYDTLRQTKTQQARRGREKSELSREEAMELVTEALAALQRDESTAVHASKIKEQILRKEPSFSEQDLGYSTFARFIEACGKAGIVRLAKDTKAGGYLVDASDTEPEGPAEPLVELSKTARPLYDMLAGEELEPLTAELRRFICDAIVAEVADRGQRKRRVNLQWVSQDVSKKARAADKRVTNRAVKGLINGLHGAGVFRHTDGEPIRSFFASFQLVHDGPGLARQMEVVLLRKLRRLGVEFVGRTADLAELLYGSRDRSRDVEEILAWELTDADSSPEAPAPKREAAPRKEATPRKSAPGLVNLEEDAAPVEDTPPAKPKRRRKPRKAAAGEAKAAPAEETAVVEAPVEETPVVEAPVEEAPAVEAAPVAEETPAEEAPAEEAPKPKRRRTRSKAPAKAAAPSPAEEALATEAATEAEDKPKPKRRRTPRKKAEPKAEATEAPAEDAKAEAPADAKE